MNFFYFFKIIFDISTLKQYKNIKKNSFQTKKIKIFKNMVQLHPSFTQPNADFMAKISLS